MAYQVIGMEPTGWCWSCGRACALGRLYCNEGCKRRHERELAVMERRGIRRGKREGYGATGSTH